MVLDALIVGAGFSGIHLLNQLRQHDFKVKVFEASSGLGGTWHNNRYPGARVDSDGYIYQLSQLNLWDDFEYKERFPGREELKRYFQHVDNKLNISKDVRFNTRVEAAEWDDKRKQWLVKSSDGHSTRAKHLMFCIGFSAKRYTPPFKGLEDFQGEWYHTGAWPEAGVDLKGKRVAIIGTGASGVQVIQEIGPMVKHLTVYQRTPNLCLPMQQCSTSDHSKYKGPAKSDYGRVFQNLRQTFGGMDFDFMEKDTKDASPEERRKFYEELFAIGGFHFWIGTYRDVLFSQEANDAAYNFWAEKVRARLNDPLKKDLLAPLTPPHAFGTKRPSLEQSYYEIFNQNNVDLINVRKSPIIEITEEGIRTEKEGIIPVDILIFATGFDCLNSGMTCIDIKGQGGISLQEKWKSGTKSLLGISIAQFPNMFFTYGPQAPTAFANGPTCGEIQGDWISGMMIWMRDGNKSSISPKQEAEDAWSELVTKLWHESLFPATDSWYQGANIPGKLREPLVYLGGIPRYIKDLGDSENNHYQGFDVV